MKLHILVFIPIPIIKEKNTPKGIKFRFFVEPNT